MLAYALSTILIVVITGFMFGIYQPNINQASNLTLAAGQVAVSCHEAAVSYAIANPTMTIPAMLTDAELTSIPSTCQRPNALGMSIEVSSGSTLGVSGRVVTSWIPSGGTFAAQPFAEVEREVLQIMHDDPSVGVAATVAGAQVLQPSVAESAAVSGTPSMPYNYSRYIHKEPLPGSVPSGAFVLQTVVNP